MYFYFLFITSFSGLLLATIIRIELAYPGRMFLGNNAERYLTVISLHGIIMVFFVIIPALYGAFGNFLLPTQLGVRDVAFPRLNSFMFWVTPSGFVLILHIFLFDKGVYFLIKNNPDFLKSSCIAQRTKADKVLDNNTILGIRPKTNKKLHTNERVSFLWRGEKDYSLGNKDQAVNTELRLINEIEVLRSIDLLDLFKTRVTTSTTNSVEGLFRSVNIKVST